MRIRVALPILLTSASVMLSGITIAMLDAAAPGSSAVAQETPRVTIPRPRPQPPEGSAEGTAEGGSGDTKIQPFRTGLEESDTRTTPPGARVSFNLEDADLPDLVRLVSRITGKRFILPSKARSIKATVYSPTDVTAAEAYQAFLSILTLNGLTLEPSGRYYKIVESGSIESKVLPLYQDGESTPVDDRFVTRMHRLENVSADDVAQLLGHFKSAEGSITAYAPTNTLIITDTGANIRRMLRIIQEIDVPRTGEQIWIEPVHYAVAEDLAGRLTEVFPTEGGSSGSGSGSGSAKAPRTPPRAGKAPVAREGAEGSAESGGGSTTTVGSSAGGEARVTNIIADERTNSLIIVATERAYLRILELIRVLDVPVEGEGSVHVHSLQYADAEVMAEVLQSLIEGGGGSSSGSGGSSSTKRAGSTGGEGGGSGATGSVSGTLTGEVAIQAYKPTNSLIITASMPDYASIRRVLDRLDVAPRQVFIEAVIMELQITRRSQLGISFHGGFPEPGVNGEDGLSVLGFNPLQSVGLPTSLVTGGSDALSALAVGVMGPRITDIPGISIPSFGVVLNALASSGDVNVLSTPHLLAMDNAEAEIEIGDNIPLQTQVGGLFGGGGAGGLGSLAGLAGSLGQTGQAGAGAAGLAGLAGLAGGAGGGLGGGGLQRQTVGTKIHLTPHINDAGEIRIEIEEEISELSARDGPLGAASIAQRTAKTQVLVRDQQTVVIGGLMRDRVETSETKVPILGDIPIIGALFRTTRRETRKTDLILFLTPYVIRAPEDLRAIFERRMRERQEFLDRYFVFGDTDYEPPIDYSRTRGVVLEIMNELETIDEERALAEQLRSRPPPEHHARAPLGQAEPFDAAVGGELYIGPDGDEQQPPPEGEAESSGVVVEGEAPQQ